MASRSGEQVHDLEQAERVFTHIMKTTKDPVGYQKAKPAVIDFVQNFGFRSDGGRLTLNLSAAEKQMLAGPDFAKHVADSHAWLNNNFLYGSNALTVDPELISWPGVQRTFGFINYSWACYFYEKLYYRKHGVAHADDKRWFDELAKLVAGSGLKVEDLLELNMRDVIMFNRYQQLRVLDARSDGLNLEAATLAFLMAKKNTWGKLNLLLNVQSYGAREKDWAANFFAHPIMAAEHYRDLQKARSTLPVVHPNALRFLQD